MNLKGNKLKFLTFGKIFKKGLMLQKNVEISWIKAQIYLPLNFPYVLKLSRCITLRHFQGSEIQFQSFA